MPRLPQRKDATTPAASPAGPVIRPVPAVKRAMEILFYLARVDERPGVARIARDLGMVRSSCLHILRELVTGGLVLFEERGKTYRLGPGLITLAQAANAGDVFVEIANRHVQDIAEAFGAKTTASVFGGKEHTIVVATSRDEADLQIQIPVGARVPMFSSAAGRVLAAFGAWTPQELQAEFAKVKWQAPLTFRQWQLELREVRTRGFAVDRGRYRRGIAIFSVPVRSGDEMPTRFLNALVFSDDSNSKADAALVARLQQSAREISVALQREA